MKQLVKKLSKVKLSKAPDAKAQRGVSANAATLKMPFGKNSKSTRVAFTLLLVRPWVLLVGFWLFSLVGGAIAIEGLISPKKLTEALPETPQITPVAKKSSLINVEQLSDDIVAADSAVEAAAEERAPATLVVGEEAQAETQRRGNFPTRTLVTLVGTCAAGCLVMSRRRAMMRMAAARARGRSRRTRPGIASAKSTLAHQQPAVRSIARKAAKPVGAKPAGVVKLAAKTGPASVSVLKQPSRSPSKSPSRSKKRRQRNKRGVAQPVALKTGGNRPLVSRSTAQKNGTARSARPKPVRKSPARVSNRHQSVVSVVPASESHALDWTNGSLAHDMDVRSQKRAM